MTLAIHGALISKWCEEDKMTEHMTANLFICKKVVSKQKDVSPKSDPSLQTREFIESSDIPCTSQTSRKKILPKKRKSTTSEKRKKKSKS